MQEVWKPVIEYEGLYEVSSFGRIRSLTRKTRGRWETLKTNHGKILSPELTSHKKPYQRVGLCKNGKCKRYFAHRLVATHFCEGSGETVNHIDGVKTNNHYENLEWCSSRENKKHACKNDLIPKGPNCYNAKFTWETVQEIRKKYEKNKYGHKRLAKEYGVSRSVMWSLVTGKSYTAKQEIRDKIQNHD